MDAAEEIFGTKGYFQTSVADITAKAGVAQGTFYLYFPSKLAIFRSLVEQLSHILRRETEHAARGARDRIEAERLGIEAFYRFVDQHRNLYRIVRQAEFVDEGLYRWYYQRMRDGYIQKLTAAMDRGDLRRVDPEVLAWCLMGASDYTGMRYILWQEQDQANAAALVDIVTHGILPARGNQ